MTPFDFQQRTRVVFGAGKISLLGSLAASLGARRAVVVSDAGIVQAGHTERAIHALQAAGIQTCLFADVHPNPSTRDVDAGLCVARQFQPHLLVGLGGGSAMDCAKGINFLFSNGGRMQDYWGVGKAHKEMLPMIAVPTTAGTGSEAQSFALIADAETHVKMACGDKKASCRIALLDPLLTVTQPQHVTAVTGIDAISHAVETYVTKARNAMSLVFSREAWRLLSANYPRVLNDPQDLEARSAMQLGAFLAGLAIENSMLGAAHALANPLTAAYGIPHGQAVGVMLPHAVRFNSPVCKDTYRELAGMASSAHRHRDSDPEPEDLVDFLVRMLELGGLKSDLASLGVEPAGLDQLAQQAARQWTAGFNPRPAEAEDMLRLYQAACTGHAASGRERRARDSNPQPQKGALHFQ